MASIRKLGKLWQAQVARQGVRTSKTFPTKLEAKDWAARQEYQILKGEGVYGPGNVGNLLDRYAREVSPTKRGGRWEMLRLENMAKLPLGSVMVKSVQPSDIAAWRDERLTQVSPGTVIREMNLLAAVFTRARKEWGVLPKSPMVGVAKPKAPPPRERLITDQEVAGILAVAGDRVGSISWRVGQAFLFAMQSAMRAGEICALRPDDVKVAVAQLHETKNGKPREVPLSSEALTIWGGLPDGHFNLTPRQLETNFRRIRKDAGLEGFVFHDTRHTAITRLAPKVHVLALAKIVGHSDPKELMTYYDETAENLAKLLG